jgi:DNA-directed RNA polymerase alpha subunit
MKLSEINKEALRAISIAVKEKHPVSILEQLGVNQRLINLLNSNGIQDMSDLLHKSKDDLLNLQNFGTKQLQILFQAISKYHTIEE